MALGIDTRNLVERWIPRLEYVLSMASFAKNRYQVHKVYACATVLTQDEAAIGEISTCTPCFSVSQGALDWQPQYQEEGIDEGDVYSHLVQMSTVGNQVSVPRADSFVTSAESSTYAASAGGRPTSSFRGNSFRLSSLEVYNDCTSPGYHVGASILQEPGGTTVYKVPNEWWESMLLDDGPELIWARAGEPSAVLWHMQVDVLDMRSWTPAPSTASKRIRRRYGPLLQVICEDNGAVSEAKRFKGVRYRRDRNTFVAEMKVPKKRNKDSFGDFKSASEAARAVDAAFYHYGRREKMNFTDNAHILATAQPTLEGLDETKMLTLVKAQAKWLASYTPGTLPSLPSPQLITAAPAVPAISQPENLLSEPPPCCSTAIANLGHCLPSPNDLPSSSSSLSFTSLLELSCDVIGDVGSASSDVAKGWLELDDAQYFHDSNELGPSSMVIDEPWDGIANSLEVYPTWKSFVDSAGLVEVQPACDELIQSQGVSVDLLSMSSSGFNLFQDVAVVADPLLQQQQQSLDFCFDDAGLVAIMQD